MTAWGIRSHHVALAALAVVLTLVIFLPIIGPVVDFSAATPPYYFADQLSVTYQTFGLVRRGLIGSLLAVVGAPTTEASIRLIYAACVVPAALLTFSYCLWTTRRLPARKRTLILVAITLSPALFFHWGTDPGRMDSVAFALFVGAAWATSGQRILVASVLLCAAQLIHESSLLICGPVVVGLMLQDWPRAGAAFRIRLLVGAGLVAAVFVALLLFGTPSFEQLAHLPAFAAGSRDLSLADPFFPWVAGLRSASAYSLCMQFTHPGEMLNLATSITIVLVHVWVLFASVRGALRLLPAVMCVAGFLLLCIIALDHGRWASVCIATLWTYRLALLSRDGAEELPLNRGALLLALTYAFGPLGIYEGPYGLTWISHRVLGLDQALLEKCGKQTYGAHWSLPVSAGADPPG